MSSIIFPSTNSWITPRTTQSKVDTNNCMLILPQKIDKIGKVLVNAATVKVLYGMSGSPGGFYNGPLSEIYYEQNLNSQVQYLDITDYIVEESKYNTLEIQNVTAEKLIVELCANNAHYYEHNGTTIFLQGTTYKGSGSFFASTSAWNMAVQASFAKLIAKNNLYYYSESNQNFVPIYSDPIAVSSMTNNPMSAQFRVYYTPLGESVKLNVPKTNPQANEFCIPYSQQQPIVDNVSHGREMQSIANRAGCETKEVVRTCHSFAELRRPRDGWYWEETDENGKKTGNIWRLTKAHYSIYCETLIITKETWSKNWSYRSEHVPINREFRSWKIPADIVQRNMLRQDYCLLTRKDGVTLPDDSWISDEAKVELMRGLSGSKDETKNSTECTNLWYWPKEEIKENVIARQGVVLNCSAFGFGNSLVFSGKSKDNLSAGVQRVKSDSNDSNYQFCKDVYYCNDDGKLDELSVQIGSSMVSTVSTSVYDYPQAQYNKTGDVVFSNNAPDPQGIMLFKDNIRFKVLKDPCEQLNFTYQLHLLTDDGYLVIGSTWAATNPLVKQRDEAQQIKVWKLTQRLPQGAQVMTPIYGTERQDNLFSVTETGDDGASVTFNGATNDGVGVCVTDSNNYVLIAFNSPEQATFRALFTHSYKAIARALK